MVSSSRWCYIFIYFIDINIIQKLHITPAWEYHCCRDLNYKIRCLQINYWAMEDVDRRFECLKILTESTGGVCYIEKKLL